MLIFLILSNSSPVSGHTGLAKGGFNVGYGFVEGRFRKSSS